MDLLTNFTENNKFFLLNEFKKQPLTNKVFSIWALTWLGGDDVAEAFKEVLEFDYAEQQFTINEMRIMTDIIHGLGHLSKDNDKAFQYLISHFNPNDWNSAVKWKAEDTFYNKNLFMASAIIQSVGLSGRSECKTITEEIIGWDQKILQRVAGNVVDANFYFSIYNAKSRKESVQSYLTLDSLIEFDRWKMTDDGANWKKWHKEILRPWEN